MNQQHSIPSEADPKSRLRPSSTRAAAPNFVQKGLMAPTISNAVAPSGSSNAGVFGKKKGWADQLADNEALQQQQGGAGTATSNSAMMPMTNIRQVASAHLAVPVSTNASRSVPYVIATQAASAATVVSKPPSPIDNAHVKFVNSTVENLQSQIKKEEAPKKKRTRTSPEQLRILQKAFATDPMPSSQARLALSKKLGMNPRAVQVWFQNRRAKAKRAESLGLNPNDDDMNSISGSDDEMMMENALPSMPRYPQPRMHDQSKMKASSSRAASMSSVLPMSYAPNPMDGGYFGLPPTQGPYFDPSSFMEHVENPFEAEMGGLDFSTMYGGYGAAPSYSMPMQGMFSLPPGSYDMANPMPILNGDGHGAGYTGYGSGIAGHYPSFTDETANLNEDVLGRFGSAEDHGLGPINPLSALLDAHSLEARHHASSSTSNFASAAAAAVASVAASAGSREGDQQAFLGPAFRRSYSLNDIHSQLTTQQIQTLENVGLPSLGPGACKTALGCIHEEEDVRPHHSGGTELSGGSPVDQDQLLSTIDDLRMGVFWDTSAPGS